MQLTRLCDLDSSTQHPETMKFGCEAAWHLSFNSVGKARLCESSVLVDRLQELAMHDNAQINNNARGALFGYKPFGLSFFGRPFGRHPDDNFRYSPYRSTFPIVYVHTGRHGNHSTPAVFRQHVSHFVVSNVAPHYPRTPSHCTHMLTQTLTLTRSHPDPLMRRTVLKCCCFVTLCTHSI